MRRRKKLLSPDNKLWSLNPSNKLLSLVLRVNDPNIITSTSGPNNNETHPSSQKTGIIVIAYNISHCGAQPRSLNVYWGCRQSRPVSVKFGDKSPVSFCHIWLETWGEAESREIEQCPPDTRAEAPPGQSNAAALRSGRNPADLSPPRARRLLLTAPVILFSAFLSSTLWPYPRRSSAPKAKEQSKRGTLPERRAQSSPAQQSPASLGDTDTPVQRLSCHRTLLTQLGQDSLELHLKPAFRFNPILWCAPAWLLSHVGGMRGQEILCR